MLSQQAFICLKLEPFTASVWLSAPTGTLFALLLGLNCWVLCGLPAASVDATLKDLPPVMWKLSRNLIGASVLLLCFLMKLLLCVSGSKVPPALQLVVNVVLVKVCALAAQVPSALHGILWAACPLLEEVRDLISSCLAHAGASFCWVVFSSAKGDRFLGTDDGPCSPQCPDTGVVSGSFLSNWNLHCAMVRFQDSHLSRISCTLARQVACPLFACRCFFPCFAAASS